MDLEVIMQKITADASGYLQAFDQIAKAQAEADRTFNMVSKALNSLGADADVGTAGIVRIAAALGTIKGNAVDATAGLDQVIARVEQLHASSAKPFGFGTFPWQLKDLGDPFGGAGNRSIDTPDPTDEFVEKAKKKARAFQEEIDRQKGMLSTAAGPGGLGLGPGVTPHPAGMGPITAEDDIANKQAELYTEAWSRALNQKHMERQLDIINERQAAANEEAIFQRTTQLYVDSWSKALDQKNMITKLDAINKQQATKDDDAIFGRTTKLYTDAWRKATGDIEKDKWQSFLVQNRIDDLATENVRKHFAQRRLAGLQAMQAGSPGSGLTGTAGSGLFQGVGSSLSGFFDGGGMGSILGQGVSHLGGALGSVLSGVGGIVSGVLGSIGSVISNLAYMATFGVVFTSIQMGAHAASEAVSFFFKTLEEGVAAVIKFGMQLENLRISFEVLAKDKSSGDALLNSIQQLALVTPYTTLQLADVGKTLLGMGVATENLLPTLSRLGDIAAGSAERLRHLAFAFGEVEAEGRLTGMRIRQFASAGVGLQDFADTIGVSAARLRIMMHNNEVDANVVAETINRLTAVGGRFYNYSVEGMKTVNGQWSNFIEKVQLLAGTLGIKLFDKFNVGGVIDKMSQALSVAFNDDTLFNAAVTGINYVGVAVQAVIDLAASAYKTFQQMFGGMADGVQAAIPSLGAVDEGIRKLIDGFISFGQVVSQILGELGKLIVNLLLRPMAAFVDWANESVQSRIMQQRLEDNQARIDKAKSGELNPAMLPIFEDERTRIMEVEGGLLKKIQNERLGKTIDQVDKAIGTGESGAMNFFGKLRENFKNQQGGGAGFFENLAQSVAGWKDRLQTSLNTDPIALKLIIEPEAEQLAAKVHKEFKAGTTPYGQYERQINLLRQGLLGPDLVHAEKNGIDAKDFIGPVRPGGLTREEFIEGRFKEFETLASKYKSPAQSLTGAFYAGSGEAQDVINKARLEQAGSIQDQIRQVLTDALQEQKEHTRLLQEFTTSIRDELLPALPQGGGG
jgi:hypothetical protein